MGNFKGSKGKWTVQEDSDSNGYINVLTDYYHGSIPLRVTVYGDVVISGSGVTEQAKADALLISKAPEMLEMLEDIKDYLGSDVRSKVEQLIKEATEL